MVFCMEQDLKTTPRRPPHKPVAPNLVVLNSGTFDSEARERIRFLKSQADWCVEMATKTLNARMFERYLELAAAYQQQATDIERRLGLIASAT